jgi:ligand-binding sensor domain-containing protein
MPVTTIQLNWFESKITATVSDGLGNLYIGTNKGFILLYVIATGAITQIDRIRGGVNAMALYGTVLYVGANTGYLYSIALS